MTKLYHYTGIDQLLEVLREDKLREDVLLSKFARWTIIATNTEISHQERYNTIVRKYLESRNPENAKVNSMILERQSYIHFLRDKEVYADNRISQRYYKIGAMVVLGFDCPDFLIEDEVNYAKVKWEVGLSYLKEIYAQKNILGVVKDQLREYGREVPVHLWYK